ncbi:MAG: helix-turn-helix domain-containing protein [Roseburia sp.]|nr:helix-turn-helix domain-containing protein [Roseburia sp.]MCM1096565.1 helix-turn-helix domain-containing protein [Ruminococcus flavefaciens]MCM1236736.1 helix-turn-helix domain-containing protein [Ruminococcus flavefaciens]
MTSGEKIAMLRKRNNLTQEQLAEALSVSRQSVSRWEMDLAFPETEKLIRLGRLFSCSIDFLLNESVGESRREEPPVTADACVAFLRECGCFFLATCAGSRPRLRPFGMIYSDGADLFIVTDSRKSVYSDLEQNELVELAGFHPVSRKWIRISGTARRDERPVSLELALAAYPNLRQKYPPGQEAFLALYRVHPEEISLR